ncbi:hypothetical protein P3L10_014420 [Capsicum annuum]
MILYPTWEDNKIIGISHMGGFPAVYSHGVYRLQILAATWIGSLAAEHQRQIPHIRGITIVGKPIGMFRASWFGILITARDPVRVVTNSFSGRLDTEIFNTSGLRNIDLSSNNLSGSLPPNLGSILPNIETLFLSELTNLVGTIPHSISNCSKLTKLELSGNKLTGLIPNSLGYLLPASTGNLSTPLRTFVAVSCKIQGRIPNDFGNLSSLLDLILSGNNLVGSIAISIGNLSNLQRFDLSNNKLTGFIGDHICKFQHLGDSYLGQNQLSNNNAMQLS